MSVGVRPLSTVRTALQVFDEMLPSAIVWDEGIGHNVSVRGGLLEQLAHGAVYVLDEEMEIHGFYSCSEDVAAIPILPEGTALSVFHEMSIEAEMAVELEQVEFEVSTVWDDELQHGNTSHNGLLKQLAGCVDYSVDKEQKLIADVIWDEDLRDDHVQIGVSLEKPLALQLMLKDPMLSDVARDEFDKLCPSSAIWDEWDDQLSGNLDSYGGLLQQLAMGEEYFGEKTVATAELTDNMFSAIDVSPLSLELATNTVTEVSDATPCKDVAWDRDSQKLLEEISCNKNVVWEEDMMDGLDTNYGLLHLEDHFGDNFMDLQMKLGTNDLLAQVGLSSFFVDTANQEVVELYADQQYEQMHQYLLVLQKLQAWELGSFSPWKEVTLVMLEGTPVWKRYSNCVKELLVLYITNDAQSTVQDSLTSAVVLSAQHSNNHIRLVQIAAGHEDAMKVIYDCSSDKKKEPYEIMLGWIYSFGLVKEIVSVPLVLMGMPSWFCCDISLSSKVKQSVLADVQSFRFGRAKTELEPYTRRQWDPGIHKLHKDSDVCLTAKVVESKWANHERAQTSELCRSQCCLGTSNISSGW